MLSFGFLSTLNRENTVVWQLLSREGNGLDAATESLFNDVMGKM
jgi:hypothetical protein